MSIKSNSFVFRLFNVLVLVTLLFSALGSTPVHAASLTVTNLNDSGGGSLREAILYANTFAGADIITFSVSGTIILGSTLPLATDVAGLTIDGTGQTVTISGNNNVRVAEVLAAGGSLTLNHLTIANGYVGNPSIGAGIEIDPGGTLIITNSTFSGNHTGAWSAGGGIFNNDGTLIITNSTFSDNSALGGNSAIKGGGGIYNDGNGIVIITNSTFSGNSATIGGAIYNNWGGTLTITNSTFSGNSATDSSISGAGIQTEGSVTIRNTIIANNISGRSCSGYITNSSNNIDDGTSCGWGSTSGSMSSTNPLLGALANNGGPTQTFALLAGSPAIDAGDNTVCAAPPVNDLDQRGLARPKDGNSNGTAICDIGAYEAAAIAIQRSAISDFNGDGKTDVAVYRPSAGTWYIKDQFYTNYGLSGDIPIPGDYNGDGKTDVAVYRPSAGTWYIKDQFYTGYGLPGDQPIPGDYNGDGKTDIAIYRPSQGTWYIKDQFYATYGLLGDIPVPGDYNGDGKTDVAVYRPSAGTWYIKDQFYANYGLPGDIPVPGDYNGDGKTDVAVYRPSQGTWYVKDQGFTTYGLPTDDIAIPGDYNGDGITDIAVYRPSAGTWYIKDQFYTGYGLPGDIPLPEMSTGKANTAP